MSSEGHLIIIVAPSGTGKSTLIERIRKRFPNLKESVSFTTRTPRKGEENGVHYHFISEQEFNLRKNRDEFVEWAQVHNNFYGTSRRVVEESLAQGESILFDLDVQGTDSFKKVFGSKAIAIFIAPPSIDELEKRLRARGTEDTAVINLRVENSKKEILRKDDYDYCVVNDHLDNAFVRLEQIISKYVENKGIKDCIRT